MVVWCRLWWGRWVELNHLSLTLFQGEFMKLASVAFGVLSLVGSFAFAADPTVKITSFRPIGGGTSRPVAAELCGKVDNIANGHAHIKAVVDYRSNDPATYNTFAGGDGSFCLVVSTYDGNVSVELW
jgi:hypothetical protein